MKTIMRCRYLIAAMLTMVTLSASAATFSKWNGITIGRSTSGQLAGMNGKRFGNTSTGMIARIDGFRTISGSSGPPAAPHTLTLTIVSGTPSGAITVNGVAIESVAGYSTSSPPTGCQGSLTLTLKTAISATLLGGGGGGGGDGGGAGGDAVFITNGGLPVFGTPDPGIWTNPGSPTAWIAASGGGGGGAGGAGGGGGGAFDSVSGGVGSDGSGSGIGGNGTNGMSGFTGGSSVTGIPGNTNPSPPGGNGGGISGATYTLSGNNSFYVGAPCEQDSCPPTNDWDGTTGTIAITTTP